MLRFYFGWLWLVMHRVHAGTDVHCYESRPVDLLKSCTHIYFPLNISGPPELTVVDFPNLREILIQNARDIRTQKTAIFIASLPHINEISFPNLERVSGGNILIDVRPPNDTAQSSQDSSADRPINVNLEKLQLINGNVSFVGITGLKMNDLKYAWGLSFVRTLLPSIDLNELEELEQELTIRDNHHLESVSFQQLQRVGGALFMVDNNPHLKNYTLPDLQIVGGTLTHGAVDPSTLINQFKSQLLVKGGMHLMFTPSSNSDETSPKISQAESHDICQSMVNKMRDKVRGPIRCMDLQGNSLDTSGSEQNHRLIRHSWMPLFIFLMALHCFS